MIENSIVDRKQIPPDSLDFINNLNLKYEGGQLRADTPNGRKEVHTSQISFQPVIYYLEAGKLFAAVVPGLSQALLPVRYDPKLSDYTSSRQAESRSQQRIDEYFSQE